MAQLMFPNIAGQAEQGFDSGRQMAFNRLAGLAVQNPHQAQNYLGQAASIDPRGALVLQTAMQNNAAAQQKAQQAQQTLNAKQLGGLARYFKTVPEAQKQAVYSSTVYPILARTASALGKPPPPDQYDPQSEAAIDGVIAQTAYLFPDDMKLQTITPGAVQTRNGVPVYSNPAAPKITPQGFQAIMGPDGTYHAQQIPIEGAQNGMGMGQAASGADAGASQAPNIGTQAPTSIIDGSVPAGTQVTQASGPDGTRVAFAFAPDTPDAVKAQAAAMGGVPQTNTPPQQGLPQTLAQAVAANKKGTALEQKISLARQMGATPDQIKAMVLGQTADPGESGMNLLTDDGKALMDAAIAHGYNMPMPSMGYGKAGTAAKAAAINSLAERFKGSGISPDQAVSQMMQGNTAISGLRSLQNVNAKIMGWETSASKQADIALDMSNQVGRTGIPLFNSWILAGRQGTGSKEVAQFNNTVNTLAEEYARVMSGGNSAATDSTRQLAHRMLNSAMTQEQFAGVVAKMRQEMQARASALQDAVNTQRGAATSNDGAYSSAWPGQAAPSAQPQSAPSGIDALLQKYGAH